MEFVTVRDLRIHTGKVWEKLEEKKDLIITSNGRPMAIMTEISGDTLEATLNAVREARGRGAIRQMRRDALQKGLDKLSEKEIEAEIKQTRQEPARRDIRR